MIIIFLMLNYGILMLLSIVFHKKSLPVCGAGITKTAEMGIFSTAVFTLRQGYFKGIWYFCFIIFINDFKLTGG